MSEIDRWNQSLLLRGPFLFRGDMTLVAVGVAAPGPGLVSAAFQREGPDGVPLVGEMPRPVAFASVQEGSAAILLLVGIETARRLRYQVGL
jgi:hypothetical protein